VADEDELVHGGEFYNPPPLPNPGATCRTPP
jgi:hypothetical protein